MGISNFIRDKKKNGQMKRKENIELLRPVVNIFMGNFQNDEKEHLIQFLTERIGTSNKVNYCQISLGPGEEINDGQVHIIHITDVEEACEYTLEKWNLLHKQIEKSKQLPTIIKNFVNYIFNEVSTTAYASKGRIRLNFILQADWTGTAITSKLIQTMKDEFKEYFTNGVHLDVYCLLDQLGYTSEKYGEERKAFNYLCLDALDKAVEDQLVDMVYILANYTSIDCLEPDSIDEIMRTAGLAMLVKDGVSAKGNGYDRDTYADVSFKEEAAAYKGNFNSLGNLKLAVDHDTIEYIVYKTVFDDLYQSVENEDSIKNVITQMDIEKEQLELQCGSIMGTSVFPERLFCSMVKAQNINVASFLNDNAESLLNAVYGKSLDYFWKINADVNMEKQRDLIELKVKKINTTLRDAYISSQCSLAEVYIIITSVEKAFNQYTKEYYSKYMDTVQELKNWLSNRVEIHNLQAVVKETGEPRAVYILADQYLNKLMHVEEAQNMHSVVSECYIQIQESVKYYRSQSDTIKKAAEELDQIIKELESEDEKLLRGNMRNYYTRVTKQIMDSSTTYANFKRNLNTKICTKEVVGDSIYDDIINYCDSNILNNEEFDNDLSVEMIRRLKNYDRYTTDEAVYDLAFETIMNQRKYYASHTEFGSVFDAVCFLVNPNNTFVNSTNKRMKSLLAQQQLKLFFEDHFNGIDILFMEGCFAKDSIYKYKLYKTAYESLIQSKPEE